MGTEHPQTVTETNCHKSSNNMVIKDEMSLCTFILLNILYCCSDYEWKSNKKLTNESDMHRDMITEKRELKPVLKCFHHDLYNE